MKKVLLIIRQGFDSDYICSHLPKGYEFSIVLETGTIARKKKLVSMFHRGRGVILTLIDLAMLLLYDRIETLLMKRCLRRKVTKGVSVDQVSLIEDINCPNTLSIIQKQIPDVIIIYGTGIVKKELLEELPVEIFNIHSSVLPAYRNVHSDFWAYMNKDYEKIGLTIFKLSTGIDTGDIALQMVSKLTEGSRLCEYKAWNLAHIPVLMKEFLGRYFEGKISCKKQEEEGQSRYETPKVGDIFRFLVIFIHTHYIY